MSSEQQTKCYVYAPISAGAWAPAGVAELFGPRAGSFYYGKTWLGRNGSYPLDPINLPLTDQRQSFASTTGLPCVLSDATADAWGRRLMLQKHTRQPQNEVEMLLASRGTGVGGLRFSLSRSGFKEPLPLAPFSDIALLQSMSVLVEQGKELPDHLAQLIEPGSSMGGARPKASFMAEDGAPWLVKFTSKTDTYDVSAVEFACAQMAGAAGINMPNTKLLEVNGTTAFAVKRFDWEGGQAKHYVSAYSLINQPVVRQNQVSGYSYSNIAAMAGRFCEDHKGDRQQLFKRMTLNSLIGNSDDHSRNHGFLFSPETNIWGLSPAFDIVPQRPWRQEQSLVVGRMGLASHTDNLLTEARQFGFKDINSAAQVVAGVVDAIRLEALRLEEYGVPSGEANSFRREWKSRCDKAERVLETVLTQSRGADHGPTID